MEGLDLHPDASTLGGIMQSALATRDSRDGHAGARPDRHVNLAPKGEGTSTRGQPQDTKSRCRRSPRQRYRVLIDERRRRINPVRTEDLHPPDIRQRPMLGPNRTCRGATDRADDGGSGGGGKRRAVVGVTTGRRAMTRSNPWHHRLVTTLKLDLVRNVTELKQQGRIRWNATRSRGWPRMNGPRTLVIPPDSDFGWPASHRNTAVQTEAEDLRQRSSGQFGVPRRRTHQTAAQTAADGSIQKVG